MPVGPHILWLDATMKSAPSDCTSTGMLGTAGQQAECEAEQGEAGVKHGWLAS